jgi:putative transcriptional regulator
MVGYEVERQASQCNGAAVMACNAAKMRLMAKQGKSHSAKTTAPGAGRVDFFPNLPDLQLADHFLIAMPSMLDPVFGGTVVYLCEHNSDGALGMIINRPTDMTMGVLFERLELSLEIGAHDGMSPSGKPVLFGGPVQVERGFVLHAPRERYSSSLVVSDDVVLTTSRDVLEQVAAGNGPERLIITLGCAGWSAGQIEKEILRNGWLTVKADPAILFDVPIEERFSAAMHLLGFDPADLAGEAGHA